MPRAVSIRTDIPGAELRRRAKAETDGRASRRMLDFRVHEIQLRFSDFPIFGSTRFN